MKRFLVNEKMENAIHAGDVAVSEEANYIEIYYIGRRSDVFEEFRRLLTQLQIPDN